MGNVGLDIIIDFAAGKIKNIFQKFGEFILIIKDHIGNLKIFGFC